MSGALGSALSSAKDRRSVARECGSKGPLGVYMPFTIVWRFGTVRCGRLRIEAAARVVHAIHYHVELRLDAFRKTRYLHPAFDRCLLIREFFFSSRRRHTRSLRDWSSDVCSSDLTGRQGVVGVLD